MKNNVIVIGDSEYVMSQAYLNGARAFRRGTPFSCNPHAFDSDAHNAWDWGHTHEAAGEHFRFGQDLITAKRNGVRFELDPLVPRDEHGDPQNGWVAEQLNVHTLSH